VARFRRETGRTHRIVHRKILKANALTRHLIQMLRFTKTTTVNAPITGEDENRIRLTALFGIKTVSKSYKTGQDGLSLTSRSVFNRIRASCP
jgi:hypothetical protein